MPKILVVDDAAFMRMVIRNALAEDGYKDVYEAADGFEAVEKYKKEKPDLVVMDITMPYMDGVEALKEIKAYDSDAIVIMTCSMGQESMLMDAIIYGARGFISKPFKMDRVKQTIRSFLLDK